MYPIVGAINYKHRKAIDLTMRELRLAVVTDQDLNKLSSAEQKDLRTKLATSLAKNDRLMRQLVNTRDNLVQTYPRVKDLGSFYIVVDGELAQRAVAKIAEEFGYVFYYLIDPTGQLTKLETSPSLLPPLAIQGKNIVRADTNESVRFKGFDMMTTVTDQGANRSREILRTPEYIDIAKKLGANVVRVSYNGSFVPDRIDDFKMIVEKAEKNGMYVVMTASSISGKHADLLYPNDELINREVELTKLLHPYSNVIMDIYNEPHDADIPTLQKSAIETISRIREQGKYSGPIIMNPKAWNTGNPNHTYYGISSREIMDDPNIIFRFNLSRALSHDPQYQTKAKCDQLFASDIIGINDMISSGKPVMIGEFTLVEDELKQSPLEEYWQKKVLAYITQHGLHYTQFQLNYYGAQAVLKGTNLKDYVLTQSGQITSDNLKTDPPTQFDK
jgi:hypothetical protein